MDFADTPAARATKQGFLSNGLSTPRGAAGESLRIIQVFEQWTEYAAAWMVW
ncbi:hypothetical protein [Hymenobacter nivis]|uniref:hypothetical protein n=1 Tax=Hymenobacter nivis TaxID=1850093 RepID=UPI0013A59A18|nr:hypothetical protein [Hymenobacter nivis]